jgi:hypothetical protein
VRRIGFSGEVSFTELVSVMKGCVSPLWMTMWQALEAISTIVMIMTSTRSGHQGVAGCRIASEDDHEQIHWGRLVSGCVRGGTSRGARSI